MTADSGLENLTDFDVVAVDIDRRLRTVRSILECKSGRGQAKEPDRLLWLAGLRDYVGVPRAALVRSTITERGRAMARRLRIETTDIRQIENRELAIAWLPGNFAHVGGYECGLAEKAADEQAKSLGYLSPSSMNFLKHEALFASSPSTLRALSDLRENLDGEAPLPTPLDIVVGGHALVALILAATEDAHRLDYSSRSALEARIERAVTVGDGNVLQVLTQADAYVEHVVEQVHEGYERAGIARIETPVEGLREIVQERPAWLPRYLDFIEALRSNVSVACELAQTAELSVFEGLVGGKAHLFTAFDHLFTAEHRQMLRLAVLTLEEIGGPATTAGLRDLAAKASFDRVPSEVPDRRGDPTPSTLRHI
ncbi:hypothetical protein [Microbacterium sp.]|uniref:hypothetical protein n=1 Tax=Microbacterium sp. TaxID=51671 RepID=UPI003A901B07